MRPSLPLRVVVRVLTVFVMLVEPIDQPPMVPLPEKIEPVNEPVVAVTVPVKVPVVANTVPVKVPVVAMTVPVKVPVVAVILPVTTTPVAVRTPVTAFRVKLPLVPVIPMPTERVPVVIEPASMLAMTKPETVV